MVYLANINNISKSVKSNNPKTVLNKINDYDIRKLIDDNKNRALNLSRTLTGKDVDSDIFNKPL
jgi:hypothetical protein